jgi:IMP dehydrogenase/GMP reductase
VKVDSVQPVQNRNDMTNFFYEQVSLDFNDLLIKPKVTSDIVSRGEISILNENGKLPLFTAPMDTVVDKTNYNEFDKLGINICLPRGENGDHSMFQSYSLKDFIKEFILEEKVLRTYTKGSSDTMYNMRTFKVLIDTANGHTKEMLDAVQEAKRLWSNKLILMVGNVANPETYRVLSEAGADYIRVGIGNGGGCLTTQQTGVGFPMASLIKKCYDVSCTLDNPAKIVADGGMKSYSDIIKALALGADYVMVGSIFNKALESCGNNYIMKKVPITQFGAEKAYSIGLPVYKKFRGMSTKEVQKKWGNNTLKTSEGIVTYRKVEYTLNGWVDNFSSYLRSAMSYSDSKTLGEFINKANIIQISDNAFKRFKK